MQFDGATGGISSSQVNTDYGYSSVPSGSEDPKKSLKQNLEENSAWVAYGNMPGGEGGFQMRSAGDVGFSVEA